MNFDFSEAGLEAPACGTDFPRCDFLFSSFHFRILVLRGGAAAHFVAHFSGEHQRHHFLIRPPRPQWMLERRWPVVLHKEMGNPRQRIRNNKRRGNPPPPLQRNRCNEQAPTDERARQVNCPGTRLAVRADVLRPETRKIGFAPHGAKSITTAVSKTGPVLSN